MFGVPDMPLGECFLQREAPLGSPVEKAFSTRQRDLFAGLDQGLNQVVDPRSELVRKSIFEPDHVDLGLDWKLVSAWTFLGLLGLVS